MNIVTPPGGTMFNILGRPRLLSVSTSAIAIVASLSPAYAQVAPREFNIPAQNLSSALVEFSRQSDVAIVVDQSLVSGRRAPAVEGAMTPEEALRRLLAGSGLSVTASAGGGYVVQDPSALLRTGEADPAALEDDEILVTGTLLRGVEPPGANVIRVGEEEVAASGAATPNQVLAQIPQLGSFMSPPFQFLTGNGATTNRPNIRGIPGFATSGGSSTLILFDGHRVVGAGITQTSPDPDIVPAPLLSSVEILPDGGSAIYGSDAVAGVLNFITRRSFDGVEVAARYGGADDYGAVDGSLTLGEDWGAGSAFASYNYSRTDEIYGSDRDFIQRRPLDNQCLPGNIISVGSSLLTFPLPLASPAQTGAANVCDSSDESTYPPSEERHSLFAGFTQDLSDNINLAVRGFYYDRFTENIGGRFRSSVTVPATNAYYQNIPNAPGRPATAGLPQTIALAFGPLDANHQKTAMQSWGVAPTLTVDLDDNWRIRLLASYSESDTEVHRRSLNASALTAALASSNPLTAFNAYNPEATNPAVMAGLLNFETYGRGLQTLTDGRVILDGDVFELPGGPLKLAVGAEVFNETYAARNRAITPGTEEAIPFVRGDRTVQAGFVELSVPIFGEANSFPGMEELTLSLSARYDNYSDSGETVNPRIGLSYDPVDWITLRGSWNESFNAASIADRTGGGDNSVQVIPARFAPGPGYNALTDANRPVLLLRGGSPNIEAQDSTSYSYGLDIEPPFLSGLRLSATYYDLEIRNQIGTPAIGNTVQNYIDFPTINVLFPTREQVDAAVLGATGAEQIPLLYAPGAPPVYAILDIRRRNLGTAHLSGLDVTASYTRPMDFGAIDISASGNYDIERTRQDGAAAPMDLLNEGSRFRLSTTVGATLGQFRAQATYQLMTGYDVVPNAANLFQEEVRSFELWNLYFRYDLENVISADNVSLSLNIDNIFDENPPDYRRDPGFTNGFTLGRLVRLGVRASF